MGCMGNNWAALARADPTSRRTLRGGRADGIDKCVEVLYDWIWLCCKKGFVRAISRVRASGLRHTGAGGSGRRPLVLLVIGPRGPGRPIFAFIIFEKGEPAG